MWYLAGLAAAFIGGGVVTYLYATKVLGLAKQVEQKVQSDVSAVKSKL